MKYSDSVPVVEQDEQEQSISSTDDENSDVESIDWFGKLYTFDELAHASSCCCPCHAQVHPVPELLDKLIQNKAIPLECFLLVYLMEVLIQIEFRAGLSTRASAPSWGEHVYSFALSIMRIGGRAVYHFVSGWGNIGTLNGEKGGKAEPMNLDRHLLPLPSWSSILKRIPQWTPDSGVYLCLLASALSNVTMVGATDSILNLEDLCVIFVSLGIDGMVIKPQLTWSKTYERFIGGEPGAVPNDLKGLQDLDPEELGKRLITEGGGIIVTTLDNKCEEIIGVDLMTKSGDSEDEVKKLKHKINIIHTCKCCLETAQQVNLVLTDQDYCTSKCEECEKVVAQWLKLCHLKIKTGDLDNFPDFPGACVRCVTGNNDIYIYIISHSNQGYFKSGLF